MIKTLSLSLFAFFITAILYAQVAEKPEDVSPLLIGEKIPDISLKTIDGKTISISTLWKGNTILIFYRGGWCPFCNAHLSEIGQIQKDLVKMGYQIIAVSPDAPQQLDKTIKQHKLEYQILCNEGGSLFKAMGVAFKAPSKNYETLLTDYSEGANKEFILPVPSLFIINEMGEIIFEYINPNYKVRISKELLTTVAYTLAVRK